MEVYAPTYYLGRNKEGKALIDFDKSGAFVMGVFANLEGIGIVVTKVFTDSNRCDIFDEFVTPKISELLQCKNKINEFEEKYNIEYFLGNTIAASIAKKETSFSVSTGKPYKGWETIEIEPEHLLFSVQSNIDNLGIKDKLKEVWSRELSSFKLKLVRSKEKSYPRTFALACILEGAKPDYNRMFDIDIPDIVIDEETNQIIEDKRHNPRYGRTSYKLPGGYFW